MDNHVNVITCLTESGRRGLTAERHIAESRRPRLCVMLACIAPHRVPVARWLAGLERQLSFLPT